jgi:hypothetical protein
LVAAQQAVALDPEFAEGHKTLGTAHLGRQAFRLAQVSLERAEDASVGNLPPGRVARQ